MDNATTHILMRTPPVAPAVEQQIDSTQRQKRKKRQTSDVWGSFTILPENEGVVKVKCNACPQEYIYHENTGTSNMKRHAPNCPGRKEEALETRQPFDETYFQLKLSEAIVKHNLPFTFVEYEEIRVLFHYLNPEAPTVSRITIKADIMKLHEKVRNDLREMLKTVTGNICLTSDLWTSIATDSYLALTAHYVDEHWILQKRVLNLRHIPPPHTGPALAPEIINLLRDWGIDKKIFTITLDNASYNDGLIDVMKRQFRLNGSAICDGAFLHVRCGAHVLNLIARAGLQIIQEVVHKIRECVKYVKSSEARKLKFARCIKEASLNCNKKVIQDLAMRWNSSICIKYKCL